MRHSTGTIAALVAAAALAVLAAPARAGDATRLQIELPPDVLSVEPGQRVDVVQVVGLDADGNRVGLGGSVPVLTASAGTIDSVEPPYRFAYRAPPRIDGPLVVTLEAHLPGTADVRGSLRLEVLPAGPYVRLRLDAASERVDWAGEIEVEVRGETREGRVVPVADRRIEVEVDGPGSVRFVRLGTYRYAAPVEPAADGRRDVVLRARVERDAAVHGALALSLGPPMPTTRGVAEAREAPSTPPETAAQPGPEKPAAEPPAGAEPDEERASGDVAWPGGRLVLTAWRVHSADAKDGEWTRVRRMPEPGAELVNREARQRLRFVVADETVTDVAATARTGGATGTAVEGAVDLRVKRNKAGRLTVTLDARTPEDGSALHVTLLLTRAAGEPSRDVVVLRRKTAAKER